MGMRGVNYHWKADEYPDQKFSNDRQIGFIAQELKEILPEVVMGDQNGYLSVDYGRLTPVLVEAIKAMKAEKDAEIDALQKQIDDLRELVTKLAAQSKNTESTYGMK
jgi:hypothetical protein